MIRSDFDPSNPDRAQERSAFLPAPAGSISHMPPSAVDGKFEEEPDAKVPLIGDPDVQPLNPGDAAKLTTAASEAIHRMPSSAIEVTVESEGRLLLVRMKGTIHAEDYRHFVPIVEKAVQQYGKIRMLVQMHDFHGWDASALWADVKFDAKHFNDIERLAIVGETAWEKWMAVVCEPFTTATIRYFPCEQATEARTWITAI